MVSVCVEVKITAKYGLEFFISILLDLLDEILKQVQHDKSKRSFFMVQDPFGISNSTIFSVIISSESVKINLIKTRSVEMLTG